jgi:hypothetical protein
MSVFVIGPKDKNFSKTAKVINVTSTSDIWSKGLSPFFLGPVNIPASPTFKMLELIDKKIAHEKEDKLQNLIKLKEKLTGNIQSFNVENAWQFSKVYDRFDDNGTPTKEWFTWRFNGLTSKKAIRYPMGKNAKPKYSWWNSQALNYIEARKQIYIPLYSNAVRNTLAFSRLMGLKSATDVILWDFDGYNHNEFYMSYDDVINCETKKMGHAFVLAMMLEGIL